LLGRRNQLNLRDALIAGIRSGLADKGGVKAGLKVSEFRQFPPDLWIVISGSDFETACYAMFDAASDPPNSGR
jgi:hypothetical protein